MDIEPFLSSVKNNHTRRNYSSILHRFIQASPNPSQDDALKWCECHANQGTYNVHLSSIISLFRYNNLPVDKLQLRMYRAPKQPVIPFDWKDRLLIHTSNQEERTLFSILFYCMMRWEGVKNLKWSGVHLAEWELETIEKRGIRRTRDSKLGPVPMTQKCVAELTKLKQERNPKSEDAVFTLKYHQALKLVQDACKAEGFNSDAFGRKPGLHSIRRGSATRVYQKLKSRNPNDALKGMDQLRRLLSHLNLLTSLEYIHANEEELKETYQDIMSDDE